jgi:MoaA/NifB/PqqE/SkfB family radical SAM enzyme
MGNVNEMHLRDIWFQEKYLGFRKKLQQGLRHQLDVCKDCNRHQVVFA